MKRNQGYFTNQAQSLLHIGYIVHIGYQAYFKPREGGVRALLFKAIKSRCLQEGIQAHSAGHGLQDGLHGPRTVSLSSHSGLAPTQSPYQEAIIKKSE